MFRSLKKTQNCFFLPKPFFFCFFETARSCHIYYITNWRKDTWSRCAICRPKKCWMIASRFFGFTTFLKQIQKKTKTTTREKKPILRPLTDVFSSPKTQTQKRNVARKNVPPRSFVVLHLPHLFLQLRTSERCRKSFYWVPPLSQPSTPLSEQLSCW